MTIGEGRKAAYGVGRRPTARLGRERAKPPARGRPEAVPAAVRTQDPRRMVWWAAAAAAVLVASWGVQQIRSGTDAVASGPPALPVPAQTGAPVRQSDLRQLVNPVPVERAAALDRSAPTSIVIPSINLRAALDEIGMLPDGRMEVPPYERAHRAAWYRLGPSPGERGSAVIVGHVDSKKAVAVFWYLTRVQPGDPVEVIRQDGDTAVFTVSSVEQFAKSHFPSDRVFADVDVPVLRLVTCGGPYDADRHAYADNVVVFASMTGVRPAGWQGG
ncbi:class F sortase [Phytohabitans aurantiacus]|uniref:Class F sortase n=1 Tax=Phytohabitans aurantiacus TaxID=3016789 RepID=A0ABQ5R7H9_9ACTN|nr:class F sortase [Phytohabitans aurantiacus]GLI02338.1 class F sortase [Phytohabitans aurantiacus]